ncbi:ABC transporter permease [Microvirga tunisiensis]|jgi:ABC-type spermidine/putrescine transport system permease subunit I|uniref:ABC transporter permease n=1 Tax=Microvirga tunisiensis TaxID=2108360 RepID=A0A5N7MJJ7_9HYPH|nr:ABC transporter permease [Microvirga tunisiensis]MPR09568.1 ABC transporter permease [Microvirga tunisiensis]MPR27225.1 ABC transporter permease [Microvirga tunisiensis]
MSEAGAKPRPNELEIVRSERSQARMFAWLSGPALLVILVVVIGPALWLLAYSFWGRDGLTLANFAELMTPSYAQSMLTTVKLAVLVTVLCAVLGYPLAYLLLLLRPGLRALLFCFVLFPLWTSVLVRTYAWQVILQRRGVLNKMLIAAGWIEQPLSLANSFSATIIGMVHVMLPFLIMPLYASMKAIDPSLMMAAANLGASRTRAFWSVFAPMSLPGLAAGMIIVFVLALGFYVTPALLGGGRVITWAMRIEQSLMISSDWGATSALGVALILVAGAIMACMAKFGGLRNALGAHS